MSEQMKELKFEDIFNREKGTVNTSGLAPVGRLDVHDGFLTDLIYMYADLEDEIKKPQRLSFKDNLVQGAVAGITIGVLGTFIVLLPYFWSVIKHWL
jgi:hypothetical protein